MKITNTGLKTTEEQAVTLTGTVESDDLPYGLPRAVTAEPPWRPTSVTARVKRWRHDGGDWSDWSTSYAALKGRRVRKDGSLGTDVVDPWPSVRSGTELGQWLDAWVRNHPDLPRPVAAPVDVEQDAPAGQTRAEVDGRD